MKTILVVEDDQNYQQLLSRKLEEAGFNILIADNGDQALNTVSTSSQQIDLIILDLIMPRMDGIEFYYNLINILNKDTPVVILTVKEGGAYPTGVRDYIIKADISLDELVDKIKSYL